MVVIISNITPALNFAVRIRFSKHFDPAFQLFLHFALWCGNTLAFLSASLAKESPEGKASVGLSPSHSPGVWKDSGLSK